MQQLSNQVFDIKTDEAHRQQKHAPADKENEKKHFTRRQAKVSQSVHLHSKKQQMIEEDAQSAE